MSDQLNHMSGQFCSCSDILSEHFLLLIGNPGRSPIITRSTFKKGVTITKFYLRVISHPSSEFTPLFGVTFTQFYLVFIIDDIVG